MVPSTKEAQRAELHKTIWRVANDLRGSVDGWDFKSYVLGMLFYRFISENLTAYLNAHERAAGRPGFDYAELSDAEAEFGRAETVAEKGFYILPSELFANVRTRLLNDLNNSLAAAARDHQKTGKGQADVDPNAVAGVLVAMLAHVAAHRLGFEFWGVRTADLRPTA